MPLPTAQMVRVDVPLTNVSIGYVNTAYIADRIFPMLPVNDQSGIVPKFGKSAWFRDGASLRAPGTASRGGGYNTDLTDTYFCHRYSYRHEIPDEIRRNARAPFNLDLSGAQFVTDKMQMRREIAFATAFFTNGIWTTDWLAGTDFTAWSDYGASTPLADVSVARDAVEGLAVPEPNVGVIGKQSWVVAKWHPDLVDTIKYTQRGQVSVEIAASLFELERLEIGRGIYTTSPQGTAEASVTYTRIWGKHLGLFYVPPAPGLMTPAAGYCMVWQEVPNANQWIKRMRNEEREVDIIEGNSYFAQKKTSADAGAFLKNLTA